jgi:large subunit ribosomal protein L6
MSRIGKLPVTIPSGVKVSTNKGEVVVEGPKGKLTQQVAEELTVAVEDGEVVLKRTSEEKKQKSLHGLYRSLINNMVEGVSNGYKIELELEGVGYKAANQGQILELNLGYSHNIYFQVPTELSVTTETKKGKRPQIFLEGIDKQLIGHVASQIRSLRKVEPYKGKGVRYVGEQVRRKAGKTAGK